MFSDLVGSTALSARMDPEDLREVISVYQKCVAETVRRFDGFVAKYLGDGVLVYFGYLWSHVGLDHGPGTAQRHVHRLR
jgi:class 3 adenylate cyclase